MSPYFDLPPINIAKDGGNYKGEIKAAVPYYGPNIRDNIPGKQEH